MTISVHYFDVRIDCSSPQEAAKVARLLHQQNGEAKKRPRRDGSSYSYTRPSSNHKELVKPLTAIQHAGSNGLSGEQLAKAAGLVGSTGIGPWMRKLTAELAAHKLDRNAVVKRRDEDRQWLPGPMIQEALEKLGG